MASYRTLQKRGMPAGLDFRVEWPTDWVDVPIPEETHDFDDALHMATVAILMAPWAAIVFAVAARPVYAEGTIAQWLEWSARQRGIDPGAMERQLVGPHAAVGCWGAQIEDGTVMRARIAMFEDGDRLVVVNCMAPDPLWASVAPAFEHMLKTFALEAPRGSRVALAPPDLPLGDSTMTDGARTSGTTASSRGPLPLPDFDGAETKMEPGEVTAADVALAATQATFEPEHPMNVRMRNSGSGLVPNVLDHHDQERWATLAPGSLRATLRVPFGWHVIDDGKRVLVFDAEGHTQVNLNLLPRGGRTDDAILVAKVPDLERQWPKMRHLRTTVEGLECLLVRDAEVDRSPIEQAYILRGAPGDMVLQTRVTSTPSHFRRAADLAQVLLRDLHFLDEATG